LNFIEDSYAELVRSLFLVGSSWGLTTGLLLQIFEDIALVGAVVSSVLWAMFQTHDAMADSLLLNFKNHPSISSEYVKLSSAAALGGLQKDGPRRQGGSRQDYRCHQCKVDKVKIKIVAMERHLLKLEYK
jgi:hypothetical protein